MSERLLLLQNIDDDKRGVEERLEQSEQARADL